MNPSESTSTTSSHHIKTKQTKTNHPKKAPKNTPPLQNKNQKKKNANHEQKSYQSAKPPLPHLEGVQMLCPEQMLTTKSQNLFRTFGKDLNGSREGVTFISKPEAECKRCQVEVDPYPEEFLPSQLLGSSGWCWTKGISVLLCPKGILFLCSEGTLLLQTLPCCLFLLWGLVDVVAMVTPGSNHLI